MTVRVRLYDKKAAAKLAAIRDEAAAIAEEQPWNEGAKTIKKWASQLLRRIEVKNKNGKWKTS